MVSVLSRLCGDRVLESVYPLHVYIYYGHCAPRHIARQMPLGLEVFGAGNVLAAATTPPPRCVCVCVMANMCFSSLCAACDALLLKCWGTRSVRHARPHANVHLCAHPARSLCAERSTFVCADGLAFSSSFVDCADLSACVCTRAPRCQCACAIIAF